MNNILDIYESLADSIEEIDDFRLYDFIYYLGINSVDKDISKEEITRLIDVLKKCSNNFMDKYNLARTLTSMIYKQNYLSLDEIERIPSEDIKYLYSEEKLHELRYYFESYSEIITPPEEIQLGMSYTIARYIHNGYCVELHYCSDTGATIEYGTKTSYDTWENEIEDIEWFNKNLKTDYILARLSCLYDDHFCNTNLTSEKIDELNLIDKILHKHKVDDINLHVDEENVLIAYDEENYWLGKDFYDFMFNELFVYNQDGKVDLIDDSDYKKLEVFRKQYEEKTNEMEKEIEYE